MKKILYLIMCAITLQGCASISPSVYSEEIISQEALSPNIIISAVFISNNSNKLVTGDEGKLIVSVTNDGDGIGYDTALVVNSDNSDIAFDNEIQIGKIFPKQIKYVKFKLNPGLNLTDGNATFIINFKDRHGYYTDKKIVIEVPLYKLENYSKGLEYKNLGEWSEAKTEFEKCLKLVPTHKNARSELDKINLVLLGLDELSKNNYPLDQITIKKAMDSDNTLYNLLLYNLGVSYFEAKRYNKASEVFEQDLIKNPKHVDEYQKLGFSYEQTEKYDKAVEAYGHAVKIAPELGNYYNNLIRNCEWNKEGLEGEEANQWEKAGYKPSQASEWKKNGFSLIEANNWRKKGFNLSEALWGIEGFKLSEIPNWVNEGFKPSEASNWKKAGFNPEQAGDWSKQKYNPDDAKLLKKECSCGVIDYYDFIAGGNPYADKGKCVRNFVAQRFQMLSERTGLFKSGDGIVFIEFSKSFRGFYASGIAQVMGVYTYPNQLGIYNTVPKLRFIKLERGYP